MSLAARAELQAVLCEDRITERLEKVLAIVNKDRKGTNGVSSNGATANFMIFDRGTFCVLPLAYLLSSQKCQGIPFSPICQN